MSYSLTFLNSLNSYMFVYFPNLPYFIFDSLCVFLPTTGYIDQIRRMVVTQSSSSFKIHSSNVLLYSNYLRLLYSLGTKFENFLIWQSVATISIHLTLAFLNFYYNQKEFKNKNLIPEQLQNVFTKRKKIFFLFKPFTSENFSDYIYSLITIYLLIFLIYYISTFFFEISLVSQFIGLLSNIIDSLVTFPQFFLIVIQRNCQYVTTLLIGQWILAAIFKAILFFCRPVPWPFRLGVGIQAGITISITLTYFQITYFNLKKNIIEEK